MRQKLRIEPYFQLCYTENSEEGGQNVKGNQGKAIKKLHWSAEKVLSYGLFAANLLLLLACLTNLYDVGLSIWMVQTAVYLFSESIIGGLLLDVIAKRMGLEDKK